MSKAATVLAVGLVGGLLGSTALVAQPPEPGDGLGRPPPRTGARPVGRAPVEPAITSADTRSRPFATDVRATERAPQYVEVRVSGSHGRAVAQTIVGDLAFVPELRTDAGARFLVRGEAAHERQRVRARLELVDRRDRSRGALVRTFLGSSTELTRFAHRFVDELVGALTGSRGTFDSRLAFSRRLAPGRKAIFTMAPDGSDLTMVTAGDRVATLPSFGQGRIWYSVATPTGVFITHTGRDERPVVGGEGVHMGVRACGDRLVFASTRDGNTDLWSAALDGTDERRLTDDPAIDISPTCGPDGRIAFVSDRSGRAQIYLLGAGGSAPIQLTRGEGAAQTPAWCPDARRPRIAFTRVGDGYRVEALNPETGETVQVSPEGGAHKDPAFSPDCRMLAWVTDEGVVVATADGRHRRLVAPGHAETVRWGRTR